MAIPSQQIGWSQRAKLLWQISKQLENLTKVMYNNGSTTTTTTANPSSTTTTTTAIPASTSTTTSTTTAAPTSIPVYFHSGSVGLLCTDPSTESSLTVLSSTPTLQVGSYVTYTNGIPLMAGGYITAQSGGGVFRSSYSNEGTLEAVSC